MHVYAISDGLELVKIGMSKNLNARLSDLCRGGKNKLIHSVEVHDADGRLIERVAHWIIRKQRRIGEWFEVPEAVAIDTIETARRDVSGPRRIVAELEGEPFTLRVTPDLLQIIDDWRRDEPDLPVRSEALRRMIKECGERRQKGKKR